MNDDTTLWHTDLAPRVRNIIAFHWHDNITIGDMRDAPDSAFLAMSQMGKKGLAELRRVAPKRGKLPPLEEFDLALGDYLELMEKWVGPRLTQS